MLSETIKTIELHDMGYGDGKLPVTVKMTDRGIAIAPKGYGEPIFIEFYEGKLRLHIWSDINQEDPTHSIDMSGALENQRALVDD